MYEGIYLIQEREFIKSKEPFYLYSNILNCNCCISSVTELILNI